MQAVRFHGKGLKRQIAPFFTARVSTLREKAWTERTVSVSATWQEVAVWEKWQPQRVLLPHHEHQREALL